MKITVSVFGRFHAFYLANQLQKRGYLKKLITSYPKFEAKKYGIKKSNVISLFHHEIAYRLYLRGLKKIIPSIDLSPQLSNYYAKAVAKKIPEDTDIFIGWSGKSEEGLKKAKKLGAITILQRGSAHIQFQYDVLKEEAELFDVNINLPSLEVIEKEKREYELANYIEVPSTFALETFIKNGINREKLIKGFRGVDLNEFQEVKKKEDVFRVVFAGGMTLQKGVHYLLQAFAELNLPNAELWLLGSKSIEMESFFKKNSGKYKHYGHIPQHELYKYYSDCSVFVINSIQDGFGMVIPQAMACGLPIITTKNTGGADLIADGREGFVIPIRDVEKLKEKILWFYNHRDECREMGQKAKQKVSSGFTWDDYGERIVNVYEKLIDE